MGIVLFSLLLSSSCESTSEDQRRLAGEWRISLSLGHPKDGVIVFHPAIPCYCVEPGELTAEAEVGRAYLDLAAMRQLSRNQTAEHFAVGDDADYYEEVIGEVKGSTVLITTRGPSGPRFEGILEGDSIRGMWMYTIHGDTLYSGHLLMNRVRTSEYTDSARVRSRRGVNAWIHEPALIPHQRVDTAPPARELPP